MGGTNGQGSRSERLWVAPTESHAGSLTYTYFLFFRLLDRSSQNILDFITNSDSQ